MTSDTKAPVAPTEAKTKKPIYKRVWVYVLAIAFIAIIANSGGNDAPAVADTTGTITTEAPAPTDAPVVTEAPAPTMTRSQENAVASAESYLDFSAFSRSGLIGQLEFEDYSTADATFAVDYLNVDWNEQAYKSAESYLDFSSFSAGELRDQLEFEGFTPEQAAYGVAQTGL